MNGPIMYCSELYEATEIRDIALEVCHEFDTDLYHLCGSSRESSLVFARVLVAIRAKKQGFLLTEIGRFLNRDHSTIYHYLNHYQPCSFN